MTPTRWLRSVSMSLLAACTIAAAVPTAAAAAPDRGAQSSVGGALLGRDGTVVLPGPGAPLLPAGVSAKSWVVADLGSGEVLAARDAHGRYLPASTMKTLTAIALIPEVERGALHRARFEDVNVEGSKVGLVPGEFYRVDTLFQAMLVVSGNDAANSLATAVGGTARALALMNATARRLQAFDTVARNPSGLDSAEQLTSAYDLALITRAGMTMPSYRTYVGTLRSRINAPGGKSFEIYNHNKLLTRYAGTTGGKTGYTVQARRTFVVTAQRGGREIVVAMLRSETMLPDATKLLDWGFAAAGRVTPVGRLVEPLAEETGQGLSPTTSSVIAPLAERSTGMAPQHRGVDAAPRAVAAAGSAVPLKVVVPAGTIVVLGALTMLRRRQIRRRRYGRTSNLRLKLPVR
ncbi:MAG TPA: serine hydrolase [Mycobacteriales bacterium]|nr:serine hydrolase [Mycobacteriales bacterium]